MSRPASPLAATTTQAAMELRLTARRGENVLVIVVIPVVVLVFFSLVTVLPEIGSSRVGALLPGTLALAVIATSLVNLGIATAYERSYGVLKRLGGSPLTRGGLVAAKIAAVLVVEAFQVALLVAVAAGFLGWSPGNDASVVLFVLVLLLGTAVFAGLGLLLAGAIRADATLALANALFLGFLLFGGVVVPLSSLPGSIADIAAVLPAAALADGFRIALGSSRADPIGPIAVLAVWGAAACALTLRTFRWE